jgi:hypothetical protein
MDENHKIYLKKTTSDSYNIHIWTKGKRKRVIHI